MIAFPRQQLGLAHGEPILGGGALEFGLQYCRWGPAAARVVGDVAFERSAHAERFEWGLPDCRISRADVDRRGGALEGLATDPPDPPDFESEAA